MYRRFLKQIFDFISALLLFILSLPLFGLISLWIRLIIGKPVFFIQERAGMNEKVFHIIKFRTMIEVKDTNGSYLQDEKRITRWGRFLRSTSLDELPELICIIMGEMSVIGPRPVPPSYSKYFTELEKKRFTVRGGLIPPEVLYYGVHPTWKNQLEYEVNYAENVSCIQDLKILVAVFRGLLNRYKSNYGEYVRKSLIEERRPLKG